MCRVSVPNRNSVSGERTALGATFGFEGGCCSGTPGPAFVSLLLSAKGTRQVFSLSCSPELISGLLCFWEASSSIEMFSGVSLRGSRNLFNRNI